MIGPIEVAGDRCERDKTARSEIYARLRSQGGISTSLCDAQRSSKTQESTENFNGTGRRR